MALVSALGAFTLVRLQQDRESLRTQVTTLEQAGVTARLERDTEQQQMDKERAAWKTKAAELETRAETAESALRAERERLGLVVTRELRANSTMPGATRWGLSAKNVGAQPESVQALLFCFDDSDTQVRKWGTAGSVPPGEEKSFDELIQWPSECTRKIVALKVYSSLGDRHALLGALVD